MFPAPPKAQGTVRPISERLYFLALEYVFGMEALPFRIVAFTTQLLNIWLLIRLVDQEPRHTHGHTRDASGIAA